MVNLNAIKQALFNGFFGGFTTLVAGSLGTVLVRSWENRRPVEEISSHHPLMTCAKVVCVALPIWYLYKHYAQGHTAKPLHSSAFELIFFASTLGVLKYTKPKVTPLLSLALALTHLSWKIFASTEKGNQLLGLS
jgi:hypothetical protein